MSERTGDVLFYALLLVLPLSSLAARRLPVSATIRMALAWVAIFAGSYLLVALWQEATGAGAALGGLAS